uniref:peptidylprolyl isomerase n=1 Tax=Ningiella ruwaisensis TaxID=2364274 RepID=UPI00109FB0C8|nr:peptidylprolyl isomerase [Ningiella ruwaisensis]
MALTNTPEIIVNGAAIPAAAIDAEVQYHPAPTRRQAMVKAAEAVIIAEVLAQKAQEIGIASNALAQKIDRELLSTKPELIDAVLDQEVAKPNASEEECRRYFEQNTERFTTSPLVEANHILLAADPDDLEQRAEMKRLAETLLNQIKSKDIDFTSAARQHSMCPSKEAGGNLGQLSKGQTVSEFERQVFAAKEGLMQTPVETRYGYHIVEVIRKIDGDALPYELVKEKIQIYLNDKVHRKAVSQYLHRLISESDIQGFNFDFDDSMLMQ